MEMTQLPVQRCLLARPGPEHSLRLLGGAETKPDHWDHRQRCAARGGDAAQSRAAIAERRGVTTGS